MSSLPTDLFGDEIPKGEVGIVQGFIRSVYKLGVDSFNAYRHRHNINKVSRHIGAIVRAACEREGFVPAGTDRAKVSASNGRLCQRWATK
jgi:hypothetical protein